MPTLQTDEAVEYDIVFSLRCVERQKRKVGAVTIIVGLSERKSPLCQKWRKETVGEPVSAGCVMMQSC
ncbi:hypothetical protein CQ064_07700 [Bacillus sp. MYb78]|uniref:Uncharacterized protein n=1 Tax=Bacillus thuringiensis TaxID=1428 RepID=A0A9X6Z540_BACTU|nr:hypothetical protein CN398_10590 [Bacillus thuringiensis]PQZ77728.1 hypothetical protein CQ064_07700 [Bacillus sp. MYb78]